MYPAAPAMLTHAMAKDSKSFYLHYEVKDISYDQLKKLIKEIQSVTGMIPKEVRDDKDRTLIG
jgi:hypothetical protein